MASCCMPGRTSMALFTRTTKLDPGAHGVRCAWAMAVHHAVSISCHRNSGYRPSRVNIMAQGLSTPDPSLNHTHLSIMRGRATTTHYTHHQVCLIVSCNTTLVPSLGLHIMPACEAGLSAGMWREHVPTQRRKKERRNNEHNSDNTKENTWYIKQEAQLSLTNRAMLVCKVVEVWQDFLSEYVDKKFTCICYRWLIRHEWIYYGSKICVIYNSYKIV